jgi:hypothetical protein
MTSVELAISRAKEKTSRLPTLTDVGGEEGILVDSHYLARSPYFGHIVMMLSPQWRTLHRYAEIVAFVVDGLRKNEDRESLILAQQSLSEISPSNIKPIVLALESRVRDEATAEIIRMDAAAALTRFALLDHKWLANAVAALTILEDIENPYVAEGICRLAGECWSQNHDAICLGILERKSELGPAKSQATFERGIIGIAIALECDDMNAIASGLDEAETWLSRSATSDSDRIPHRAKAYLLLTQALRDIARERPAPSRIADDLRMEALALAISASPSSGFEWLVPPSTAELEWIPLIDNIVKVSRHLGKPSWLEASSILSQVVSLYTATQSRRLRFGALDHLINPAIEASFIRERGLLAHLEEWSKSNYAGLDADDASALRKNIERRIRQRPDPGKR